jgi:hypothetical protein
MKCVSLGSFFLALLTVVTIASCASTMQPLTMRPINAVLIKLYTWESVFETSAEKPIGTTARIQVQFQPMTVIPVRYGHDGIKTIIDQSYSPWMDNSVAEMQVCVGLGVPCQPDDAWIPFTTVQDFDVFVDWVGPRAVWIVARFRDKDKKPVATMTYRDTQPKDYVQDAREIVGIWETATPIAQQASLVQTAVAIAPAVSPVSGTVMVGERGGGTEGTVGTILATFAATSTQGTIVEMRTGVSNECLIEATIPTMAWEPFTPTKELAIPIHINFIVWHVSAQYRDTLGNVSSVYCDEIVMEGMPAMTPSR